MARKNKNLIKSGNPYSKGNFTYDIEKGTYICPLGQILENQNEYVGKKNKRKSCIGLIIVKIVLISLNALENIVIGQLRIMVLRLSFACSEKWNLSGLRKFTVCVHR